MSRAKPIDLSTPEALQKQLAKMLPGIRDRLKEITTLFRDAQIPIDMDTSMALLVIAADMYRAQAASLFVAGSSYPNVRGSYMFGASMAYIIAEKSEACVTPEPKGDA